MALQIHLRITCLPGHLFSKDVKLWSIFTWNLSCRLCEFRLHETAIDVSDTVPSFRFNTAEGTVNKQESIPVGCIPPNFLVPGGLPNPLTSGRPPRRHTLSVGRPPRRQTPFERQTSSLQKADISLWTEWHRQLKTLPCAKLRLRTIKTLHKLIISFKLIIYLWLLQQRNIMLTEPVLGSQRLVISVSFARQKDILLRLCNRVLKRKVTFGAGSRTESSTFNLHSFYKWVTHVFWEIYRRRCSWIRMKARPIQTPCTAYLEPGC